MEAFNLKIIAPDKTFFEGSVVSLIVETPDGKIGILAHHAPLAATLSAGEIKYTLPNGEEKKFTLEGGGLLKIDNNRVTVVY
jgi:F-type H+-transporting ATPase subunit epsilon